MSNWKLNLPKIDLQQSINQANTLKANPKNVIEYALKLNYS